MSTTVKLGSARAAWLTKPTRSVLVSVPHELNEKGHKSHIIFLNGFGKKEREAPSYDKSEFCSIVLLALLASCGKVA